MNIQRFEIMTLVVGLFTATTLGCESDDTLSRAVGEDRTTQAVQASTDGQTCLTLQRGLVGDVFDTKLREDAPDVNFGARDTFVTGDQFSKRIALIRYDIGSIQRGMIINSAVVTLNEVSNLGASNVDVYAASAPWDENTVTWNSFQFSYNPAVVASFSNGGSGYHGAISFDLTALVTSWYGGTPNYGVALLATTDSTWAASEKADQVLRPSLQVCYSPPTCSDGIQNQGETGVDCGGPCAPCNGTTCQAPGGNIVPNGSLEDFNSAFVNTLGNYMSLAAGNTAITNWTVAPATVGSIVWGQSPTIDGFTAANGKFFVDLTGFSANSTNGALQQTVTLSAGVPYDFSIDVASFNNGQVSVAIGSHTLVLTPSASFVVAGTSWTRLTCTLIGDPLEPTPLLRVMNISPGSVIVFVDNISLRCGG